MWTYFWITLGLVPVGVTYVLAVIYFRRMYFMVVEIEARLIQIRNMMEAEAVEKKEAVAKKAAPNHLGRPGRGGTRQPLVP